MEEHTYKSETSKTYIINGKTYTRLEDIPEEFKSMFDDKDNDGIPDQLDD
jgi:hypothetical protein